MNRYFTYYWKNSTCEETKPYEGLIDLWESSNMFYGRGIKEDDYVYSVTIKNGALYLIACLQVDKILTYEQAINYLGSELVELWTANYYIIAKKATRIMLENNIPLDTVKKIQLISTKGKLNKLKFLDNDLLDKQTLRPIRELTKESANLLNQYVGSFEKIAPEERASYLEQWKLRPVNTR